MNRVMLIGNVTKDVEKQTTSSGISICKFTIAVNRRFENANGEKETDFLNIVTWRTLADNCAKFLNKGKKVAVFGAIQTRSFDGQDGQKHYVTEIMADEVEFLSSTTVQNDKMQKIEESEVDDDNLPF